MTTLMDDMEERCWDEGCERPAVAEEGGEWRCLQHLTVKRVEEIAARRVQRIEDDGVLYDE